MQPADLITIIAFILTIIGAAFLGFVIGRITHQRNIPMANSADQLRAAAADAVSVNKAKDAQIADLTSQLTAAQADLAADEQAIAEIIPTLPKSNPTPAA